MLVIFWFYLKFKYTLHELFSFQLFRVKSLYNTEHQNYWLKPKSLLMSFLNSSNIKDLDTYKNNDHFLNSFYEGRLKNNVRFLARGEVVGEPPLLTDLNTQGWYWFMPFAWSCIRFWFSVQYDCCNDKNQLNVFTNDKYWPMMASHSFLCLFGYF